MAETIEDSNFTSAQKRCQDLKARHGQAKRPSPVEVKSPDERAASEFVSGTGEPPCGSSRHLSPVALPGGSSTTGPCVHKRGHRCSNMGFLPISTADYLSLLDWTARQARADKRGTTPKRFVPLFDRLGISVEIWSHLVKDFGRLFSVVAGQPQKTDEHRSSSKNISRRYHARRETRELMASA